MPMHPQDSSCPLMEVGEHFDLSTMRSMCSSMGFVDADCNYPHTELAS